MKLGRIKRLGEGHETRTGSKDKHRIKKQNIIKRQGKEQEKKEGSRDKERTKL
jgi:hypothetical protein